MIDVEYLDHLGKDDTVVNAARVSFDREADQFSPQENAKLIRYLARHGHWSPFSHCFVQFRINAPIFVARQLQKHTVGLAWNEVSRRYVSDPPYFFAAEAWRNRSASAKQGSDQACSARVQLLADDGYNQLLGQAYDLYNMLIAEGVCPEQARMLLPQSMMTQWYWSGSLYAFARVCKLRLDPHTQQETREVASKINDHMAHLYPISWQELMGATHDG